MRQFLQKHRHIKNAAAFLLVLCLILEGLSQLSVRLGRDKEPLRNYATSSLFYEPKNTIDVLTIGTSNVFSGVSPLQWWQSYGITGFAWGEPSQRIFETYQYLKRIYRFQSPKVVYLEIDDLYRDATQMQVADSYVKSRLATLFPILTYHRNLAPGKFRNWNADPQSVMKGYELRTSIQAPSNSRDYMKYDQTQEPISRLCQIELRRCIQYCQAQGSQVVLISVPDRGWNIHRHNAVDALAQFCNVPYLDLNLELQDEIDWNCDTADGGTHMNYKGAQKVTAYLGQYLMEHFQLTDHRQDAAFDDWNVDWSLYNEALQKLA